MSRLDGTFSDPQLDNPAPQEGPGPVAPPGCGQAYLQGGQGRPGAARPGHEKRFNGNLSAVAKQAQAADSSGNLRRSGPGLQHPTQTDASPTSGNYDHQQRVQKRSWHSKPAKHPLQAVKRARTAADAAISRLMYTPDLFSGAATPSTRCAANQSKSCITQSRRSAEPHVAGAVT